MNPTNLSPETCQQVLSKLFADGVIGPKEVETAILTSPTNEMKRIVDTVHSLFCSENHENICGYHKEEILEDAWTMPFHKEWFREALKLMDVIGVSTEAAFNLAYKNALVLLNNSNKLRENDPSGYLLYTALLKLCESFTEVKQEEDKVE